MLCSIITVSYEGQKRQQPDSSGSDPFFTFSSGVSMMVDFLKNIVTLLREGEINRKFKPAFSGPPEKPEYYIWWSTEKDFPEPNHSINRYLIKTRERDDELLRLRKDCYAAAHPELKLDPQNAADPFDLLDPSFLVLPEHMPKFHQFIEDESLIDPMTVLHSSPGKIQPYKLVCQAWKEAIELIAPGECQFFPYEYRHVDGTVLHKRFIIRSLAPPTGKLFSFQKSGAHRYRLPKAGWTWDLMHERPYYKKLRDGQLVCYRSAFHGFNLIWSFSYFFVSAKLYERLKHHCSEYTAFYPIHIDDEEPTNG